MALLLFTKIKIPLRILCLPVLIPFLLSTAFAQSRVVSGKVFDQQNNDNLPGVTVIQKGTKNGTLTNEDGTFSLSLIGDAEQTLVFNFIGYALQEMDVSQTSTVNIGMADDILSLDEVVVIGYDAVRKSDLTGAVSSIKGDEILKTGRATLEESLLGRLAGVQVQPTDGTPGGGIAIRIRGGSSLTAGNQPLYVIDGFPLTPAANGFENPMVNLNPADIESIEVLKDASATAIYGANGANGVVIITTKQGKNSGGKPKVNVTGFYGFSNIAENIDNVSPEQHTQFLTEFYWNDRKFTASQAWATVPGEAGTDYLDKYTRTGEIQRVSASVQNGTDNGLSYFASLSYHNEEPILVNSTFERFTGNVKVRQEVGKFDMGINMYYGQTNKSGYVHNDYSIFGSVFRNLANTRPFAGVDMRPFFQAFSDEVDLDSESDDPFQDEAGAGVFEDFDAVFYGGVNESRRQDIRVNIDASYDIFDWLNLSAYYGFNRAENPSEIFNESTTLAGTPGGNARITFSNFEDDVFNTKLAFNKIVNQHSINAIALYERRSNSYSWVSQTASNFSSEVLTTRNFGLADIIGIPAIFEGRETIESYAGRVNYNFAGRYLFTASFRADASSKFSENNKWGYFPSASAAWRISEEAFMASVDQVSNLKVRVGWGTSGNSQIGFYPSFDELVSFKYPLDGEPATAILTEDELANNNVKWETVEQLNIGLDIGLFNNRINITADYYNKITRDLLLENQLPSTTGFEFITENVGSVRNRGFEFAVSSVNIKKPKFT
ncbi:MAG: SusC/RagA family TonB-linked outer membrane protein, partial [Bacteroidota bacterium]